MNIGRSRQGVINKPVHRSVIDELEDRTVPSSFACALSNGVIVGTCAGRENSIVNDRARFRSW